MSIGRKYLREFEKERIEKMEERNIFVSARLRPLNEKERNDDVSDWECINDTTIIYNISFSPSERLMYPSAYTFDRVFSNDCSTRQVYEEAAKEVALSVVKGINSSILAYGQTSSGKTYTMTGITEYAIADIYEYVQKHAERDFVLKFSALEIYNESVRDLLREDNTPLRLLDDPERGTVIEKLTEETLRDWNHVIHLLSICEDQRQIGETSLNETSSRSHQIIRLTIESSASEHLGRDNSSNLLATLNFVDLAGSERVSQSLAAGIRLKEGCHINRSLLTLGTVIRKLSKDKTGHIPFRDSKLTRILQPSLGGNGRTAIICTISPARSHVEQSRNTLLFASCAKEVTINTQENVVMSDKALVKHLQRELARLESELRYPRACIFPSDYEALLQEKDHHIQQLEKEIKDLLLQRDIAQSQIKDLLKQLGDDVKQVSFGHYPNLRVKRSPDYQSPMQQNSILRDPRYIDLDVRARSIGHSRCSSEDQFIHVPEFEETIFRNNTFPMLLVGSSNNSRSDSCQGWDEAEKQSNETSEDLCKEVRCIETEQSSVKGTQEFNYSFLENGVFPTFVTTINGEKTNQGTISPLYNMNRRSVTPLQKQNGELKPSAFKDDQESVSSSFFEEGRKSHRDSVSFPLRFEQALESPKCKNDKEPVSLLLKKEKEEAKLVFVHSSNAPPEKLSSPCDLNGDLSSNRNLKLCRSTSCKASLITDRYSPYLKESNRNKNTPPSDSERNFNSRPQDSEIRMSPLNHGSDVKCSSGNDSTFHAEIAVNTDLEAPKRKPLTDEDVNDADGACNARTNKMDELQHETDVKDSQVQEAEPELDKPSTSTLRGVDPADDDYRSRYSWPAEFKRLQKEIIELWHACNVSLAHRTYFFLLFQGDSTDAIYMEVEIKRLTFLKDTFSRGEKTVVNGRTLSLEGSKKDLREEKRMLSKQIQKKLSEAERESLYIKWGIGINSKRRRLHLAEKLWSSKADDMNHITESAYLVAKLAGLMEPGKAPKEMFGLEIPGTSRNYSFKTGLKSLL
ncbi:kinesin-like protein KIN-7F [Capsicum chacoense]|nr:kinesin-like protein KIN-7F [Capsicum annuum]KAF3633416.1 Kinesin-like protein NACK2 [Capsicum annuum]KAF3641619.1 Kinesin-like protein NACK2 [Capsicum annuum]